MVVVLSRRINWFSVHVLFYNTSTFSSEMAQCAGHMHTRVILWLELQPSICSVATKIALHLDLASINRQFVNFFHCKKLLCILLFPHLIGNLHHFFIRSWFAKKNVWANIHLLWEYKLLRLPRRVDTKCELRITNTKIQVQKYNLQDKNYKQQKSIRKVTKIPRMPGRQPAQKSSFLLLFYRLQSSNKFSFTFENLFFCPAFPVSIYLNDSEGVGKTPFSLFLLLTIESWTLQLYVSSSFPRLSHNRLRAYSSSQA